MLRDEGSEGRMRELRGEELEEALELVGVAAHRGRELGGIGLGGLDGAYLELEPSVEALDAAEHADRVALLEPAVEQLDVVPDASLDPPARVDELEREVRLPAPRRQSPLPCDREDAVDRAILYQVGDRPHEVSLGRCRLDRWPMSVRSAPSATPGRAQR